MSNQVTPTISILAILLFTVGCFFEVSSSMSGMPVATELGSRIELEFAHRTGGVDSTIRCPGELAGQEGNRFMCSGETSDGYTLEIAVLERGGNAFRWDVVESKPIR
jgi:hypothetical protein